MRGELGGHPAVSGSVLKYCPQFMVDPQRRGMFRFMDAKPIAVVRGLEGEAEVTAAAKNVTRFRLV